METTVKFINTVYSDEQVSYLLSELGRIPVKNEVVELTINNIDRRCEVHYVVHAPNDKLVKVFFTRG